MTIHLTDSVVKALLAPSSGNRIYYDDAVVGFGARVTAAGHRSFVLNYRTGSGRERRYTIGSASDWRTSAAREEARRLKLEIRANGADPVGGLQAARAEPTVADLCTRYLEEHAPKKRTKSVREDKSLIRSRILPVLGALKVRDVTFTDIDALHRKITRRGTPYRANRTISLLSKAFALAIQWRWRTDNPCKGIQRNPEAKRTRYLSAAELERLTAALTAHPDQCAVNAIRLLLFTGARSGETLASRWEDFELGEGVWTKPGSTTKQKTEHRIPLSAPARQLLAEMHHDGEHLFPGVNGIGHRVDLKRPWAAICKAANLKNVRIHDLRHSYAAVLASSGMSLHVIGGLLGHSTAQTTHRYAHLVDSALRSAAETAGAIIAGKPSADVVSIKGSR